MLNFTRNSSYQDLSCFVLDKNVSVLGVLHLSTILSLCGLISSGFNSSLACAVMFLYHDIKLSLDLKNVEVFS